MIKTKQKLNRRKYKKCSLYGTERLQIEREIEAQRFLRYLCSEDELSVNYLKPIFRRRPPEEVEASWRKEIERLRKMLEEYEKSMKKESK